MDSIQKLYSDVEKIRKHCRTEKGSSYDGLELAEQIKSLLARTNPALPSLAESFAEYWTNTYIRPSANPADEPTRENVDRLAAMQCLSKSDWKELCALTNYEAEDLPIDTLNSMMAIFVDKGAL